MNQSKIEWARRTWNAWFEGQFYNEAPYITPGITNFTVLY